MPRTDKELTRGGVTTAHQDSISFNQTNMECSQGHCHICVSSTVPPREALASLPLKMWNELANSDLLRHLLVEVMAIEHHGLQNGQGPLKDGDVNG